SEADSGGLSGRDNYEESAAFRIWLHHADKQLNIQLSRDAVDGTLARETFAALTSENARRIDQELRNRFGADGLYTVETLYQVLGDELRLRPARSALHGEGPRAR